MSMFANIEAFLMDIAVKPCPYGFKCLNKSTCGNEHPTKTSKKPCRYGQQCSRSDVCRYRHPKPNPCPQGLSCRGPCKLYHSGRIYRDCYDDEFCDRIGTCKYLHSKPSPCRLGFECDNKECIFTHETKEEYYVRLSEIKNTCVDTEFTHLHTDLTPDSEHNRIRHKCSCPRCPNIFKSSNLLCSDQCGGFTEKLPQSRGMYNGTHGPAQGSCYHQHGQCLIADCQRPCETLTIQYSGPLLSFKYIAHPFCKFHAPKCECGRPCITFKNAPYMEGTTPESMETLMTSYNKYCYTCYQNSKKAK